MCMNEMMAIDAQGGLGLAGARNTLPLALRQVRAPQARCSARRRPMSPASARSDDAEGADGELPRRPRRRRRCSRAGIAAADAAARSTTRSASRRLAVLKPRRISMSDNLDHRSSFIFGRLTLEALPLHEPILVVDLHRRGAARRRRAVRRHHLVPAVGLSLARVVHQRRPQEDRHHVHGARPRHAAARLCRRDHDARCSRRWPSAAPRAICRRTTTTRSSPRTA